MVVFALIGNKINTSNTARITNRPKSINNEVDVLDQLMGLNVKPAYIDESSYNSKKSDFNTSSFNLDDIMNRISEKNSDATIDYKYALLTSLYSQVDHLKQQLLSKDKIIDYLIATTSLSSNYDGTLETSDDLVSSNISNLTNANNVSTPHNSTSSSSVEIIQEITNPQENPFFNDYCVFTSNTSSLYSDISTTSLITSTSDESISSESSNDCTAFGAWEKHSNGFGSKMLHKFGYNEGGIGKREDGIKKPIEASSGMKHFSLKDKGCCRRVENEVHCWPKGTTLITGSSIIMGLEENRLRKYKAKVRPFPGARVDDMYDYLAPLLKKKPSNVIIHIGSNDAPSKSANDIANEIRCLKSFIEQKVPDVKLFVSCPVLRLDNKKANNILRELNILLKSAGKFVCNDNVDSSCLGRKGLHLNLKGSGRLAINFISLMRRL